MSEEQKEGNFEAFVEKIKRKRRRKGDGDATVPIDDPIRPNTDESAVELPLPTIKENLIVAENATPVLKSSVEEKNYAEFLLARSGNMLACRRSSCGRKAYPIGGTLGSLTLEQMAERQGWRVTKGRKIHSDIINEHVVAWFEGDAKMIRRFGANPVWSDVENVKRSDYIHDDVLELFLD